MKTDSERTGGAAVAGAAPCSANLIRLTNETKIKFCNAWHEMLLHLGNCDACCEYMYHGIGDLCDIGKDIIARKLAYAETQLDSPNDRTERQPPGEAVALQPNLPTTKDAGTGQRGGCSLQ